MKKSKPSITIIGAGAVGSAWLDFFKADGYPIQSVWRTESSWFQAEETGNKISLSYSLPNSDEQIGDWVFLTTPDDLIESTAKQLSEKEIHWSGKTIIHCSGSLSASVLSALSDKEAKTVSVHPIQTFKKGDGFEKLRNIYISLQGNSTAIESLKRVVDKLNSKALLLNEKQKKAVHVSAVFASNYLVALLNISDQLLKQEGIVDGVNILEPLIQTTLNNILEKGVEISLTGPVSRGDVNTVREHIEFLSNDSQKQELYCALGQICLNISRNKDSVSVTRLSQIEKLLRESTI